MRQDLLRDRRKDYKKHYEQQKRRGGKRLHSTGISPFPLVYVGRWRIGDTITGIDTLCGCRKQDKGQKQHAQKHKHEKNALIPRLRRGGLEIPFQPQRGDVIGGVHQHRGKHRPGGVHRQCQNDTAEEIRR